MPNVRHERGLGARSGLRNVRSMEGLDTIAIPQALLHVDTGDFVAKRLVELASTRVEREYVQTDGRHAQFSAERLESLEGALGMTPAAMLL